MNIVGEDGPEGRIGEVRARTLVVLAAALVRMGLEP